MEGGAEKEPLIDLEVRAFVFSLVSALGGTSAADDGRYILGDDALAVLKDIKRWLRLYDDKLMRLDIARLLAEANLVKGDLLEILASWPEDAAEGSFKSKIALYCVDLLTQLTWPIEVDEQNTPLHRYLHIPFLRKAQLGYKNAILHHSNIQVLRTVVRVGLPAMAQAQSERTPQEDTIIKMVLYFLRNVALISQPQAVASIDEVETDVSRSTTIDSFHHQSIFDLILTICSGMTEEFTTHDVEVLDILFHVVKGVDVEKLFMEEEETVSSDTKELQGLLRKEKGMLAGYAKNTASRHNRFGAMLWIKRDGPHHSTVFGQKAFGNERLSMVEMDKRKQWRKPKRVPRRDTSENSSVAFDSVITLTHRAKRHLRIFVEQFLDSSFNPLFLAVRRAIEREVSRVQEMHIRQYLYLVSWFLRAESLRRRKKAGEQSKPLSLTNAEVESFSIVAAVLNQETFVLLNRCMQKAQDNKEWQDLNAGMKCFTQILSTVQEMSESPLDEDQEISENILNRIFYEQTTHDRIVALLRSHKDQGFGYLDACTELSHVFLRLLERYSKQNIDMQVRSRRRARKKKQEAHSINDTSAERQDNDATEEGDVADAQRTTTERKFDFSRFAAKFVNQSSVDTFVALLRHYQDLSAEQLKRVHRFFYRVAFKMDLTTFLFRMDIISLLHKIVKGPEGLDIQSSSFKEWEDLVRQIFRKLTKKLEDTPELAVELLFSKISSTLFYLEFGHDKELPFKTSRAAAELEVKPGMDSDQQIGVAVSVLINQSKSDALAWTKEVLSSAANERKSWEDMNMASTINEDRQRQTEGSNEVETNEEQSTADAGNQQTEQSGTTDRPQPPSILFKADNPEREIAMHRDKHLRLLLSLLGGQRLGQTSGNEDGTSTIWIIPSSLSSSDLSYKRDLINKFEFDPPIYEDGKAAEDFIRRKNLARPNRRTENGVNNDSEGDSASDIEQLFPVGGPTMRQSSAAPSGTKRRRNRHNPDGFVDENVLEERRKARRKLEAERAARTKSSLFVRDSDDESDEERDRSFFEKEELRRQKTGKALLEALQVRATNSENITGSKKRGSFSQGDEVSDEDTDRPTKRRRSRAAVSLNEDDLSDQSETETDAAASPQSTGREKTHSTTNLNNTGSSTNDSEAETDNETPASSQRPSSGYMSLSGQQPIQTHLDAAGPPQTSYDSDSGSDKENEGVAPILAPLPKVRRNVRAGFVIESDSE